MPRHQFLTLAICAICLGCGQNDPASTAHQQVALPVIQLPAQNWTKPLTDQELQAFVTIVNNLPDRKVPEFQPQQNPTGNSNATRNAAQFVKETRETYRSALNMKAMGAEWQRDAALSERFEGMHVHPETFATLTTRISLAWAAASIRKDVPMLATERKLRERLEFLTWRYDHPETAQVQSNELPNLEQEIRETVALAEFLGLLKSVPDESVALIQQNAKSLEKFLPKSDVAAQFSHVTESHPEVIRVGHSSN